MIDALVAERAFQVGRLLNRISWHARIACLWLRKEKIAEVEPLLGELVVAVRPLVRNTKRNQIDSLIRGLGSRLEAFLGSEAFGEAYAAAVEFVQDGAKQGALAEELRVQAYGNLLGRIEFATVDLMDEVRTAIDPSLQLWMDLGRRLDEVVRPTADMPELMARLDVETDFVDETPPVASQLPPHPQWRQLVLHDWREASTNAAITGLGDGLPDASWGTASVEELATAIHDELLQFGPDGPGGAPALTGRQEEMLQALFQLGAFTREDRKSLAEVVKVAYGRDADSNSYKEVSVDLVSLGLTDTRDGRNGGTWLTRRGKAIAERLASE